MAQVRVKDRAGIERVLEVADGSRLMEALRDADTGVEGTCGGECACGTCHVYVAAGWLTRLRAPSEDELAMLDAVSGLVEVRPESRLSCQIRIDAALSGLELEVAPGV